jgi:hypothetical protein
VPSRRVRGDALVGCGHIIRLYHASQTWGAYIQAEPGQQVIDQQEAEYEMVWFCVKIESYAVVL